MKSEVWAKACSGRDTSAKRYLHQVQTLHLKLTHSVNLQMKRRSFSSSINAPTCITHVRATQPFARVSSKMTRTQPRSALIPQRMCVQVGHEVLEQVTPVLNKGCPHQLWKDLPVTTRVSRPAASLQTFSCPSLKSPSNFCTEFLEAQLMLYLYASLL